MSSISRAEILVGWILAIGAAAGVRIMRPELVAARKYAIQIRIGILPSLAFLSAVILWAIGTATSYPTLRTKDGSIAWSDYAIFAAGCVGLLLAIVVIGVIAFGLRLGR